MALGEIPPWLNVSSSDFVRAAEAGASTGISAERQRASTEEAGNRLRLAYDTLASQERRQDEMAQAKMDLAQSQMEMRDRATTAALALRESQMQGLQDYRERNLGFREQRAGDLYDYRNALLGQASDRLGLQTQRFQESQQAAEALRKSRTETSAWRRQYEDARLAIAKASEARKAAAAPDWKDLLKEPPAAPRRSLRSYLPTFLGGTPAPTAAAPAATALPPSAATPTDNEFVVVTNPSGKKVRIRQAQLDEALAQGYTQ